MDAPAFLPGEVEQRTSERGLGFPLILLIGMGKSTVKYWRRVSRGRRFLSTAQGDHVTPTAQFVAAICPPCHHANAFVPIVGARISLADGVAIGVGKLALDGVGVPQTALVQHRGRAERKPWPVISSLVKPSGRIEAEVRFALLAEGFPFGVRAALFERVRITQPAQQ
jgi:hypothetical protein